jgi:hypothetical protein
MEEGPEARRFRAWFRYEQGRTRLFDVKLYPADTEGVTTEALFGELNGLLKLRAQLAFLEKEGMF